LEKSATCDQFPSPREEAVIRNSREELLRARRDDPGLCPGDGWQVLASRGKARDKGQPGPPGKKGEWGERAAPKDDNR